MSESTFSEYWARAQFCYFKAEAAKGPESKHLWIQLAQDWIALADTLVPSQSGEQIEYRPPDQLEQLEPFLIA
jgi:hypothetical protein